jgi:hypothetical protein
MNGKGYGRKKLWHNLRHSLVHTVPHEYKADKQSEISGHGSEYEDEGLLGYSTV